MGKTKNTLKNGAMKAIVFDGALRFVNDYPIPEPGKGEALIKVHLAGICKTDLEIIKGYMDFRGIIGHEFVGVVDMVVGGDPRFIGKRVVGDINCGCGVCEYCRSGLKRHCPARRTLGIEARNGALAEYLALPVDNLFEVPESVKDEEAVFTEPLAAAYEILEQIHVKTTDRVLVMGDGKLGLLVALALHWSQARVVLAGKHEKKLLIAKDQGVPIMIMDNLVARKAFDIVVEATGSPEGLETAFCCVKPRGVIVLKTTVAEGTTINLAPVVIDEIHVVGSRCGPFEPALRALSDKRIRVGPLIAGIFSFLRAAEAFEKATKKDSLKVLIDFSK
jgi:threonine dehydrogenase-like Zn-dependent dehydrogenase